MQASLAIAGCVAGVIGGWSLNDTGSIVAALLLGIIVAFTLIVILPTNKRLLDPALDASGAEAASLLRRWGRLHAVRSVLSVAAFLIFVIRLLALGADFVLMGRAWAYALAARGEAGVAHVLKLIDAEMRVAMALTGSTSVAQLNETILERSGNQATF